MDKPKVFVSFDYETDYELKETLMGQSQLDDSPFSVTDVSLKEREPEKTWRRKARRAIGRCDVFVVILGRNTHTANGVIDEIQIAKELGKRRFQLRPQGKKWGTMKNGGKLVVWTWNNLKREFS